MEALMQDAGPQPAGGRERASFGFRDVPAADKQRLVDGVFDSVARRYDLMNDLMSGGVHRLWKDAFVTWLAPPRHSSVPFRVLDVAGGTGDIAFRIVERSDAARITVADINAEMLAVGRQRLAGRAYTRRIDFVEANAEALPFGDGEYDAVTIAFGIRNVPRIDRALTEAFRVLRPGGRFLCLEFSAVDVAGLDRLYELFSFNVIPHIGELVVGDGEPYRYLVESIRRFPNQARFAAMIENAGFSRVTIRNLSGGIAAMHSGWKL
jgi:demethylmenaquinone methyltransferase/2-methoxy-6-polyprenyl-1,4-benzoquinol methylase